MITWVLFLGIGLIVGIIAGLYFARLDDFSNKQKNALQQKLDAAEQQLKAYHTQVAEHFLKTASLVKSMTESYKAVHEHLALGARELCGNQVTVAQLEMPANRLLDNTAQEPQERQPMKNAVAPESSNFTERGTFEEALQEDASAMEDAEPATESAETAAIQPPSTPESLHVVESDPSKSTKEETATAPVNVSRMVH